MLRGFKRPAFRERYTVLGRCAFIGMAGTSKTTNIGLLDATAMDLRKKRQGFSSLIVEGNSGIKEAKDRLFRGRFPEKTPVIPGGRDRGFEAQLRLRQEGRLGLTTKQADVPVLECAGEVVENWGRRFEKGMYALDSKDKYTAGELYDYVFQSSAFMLTVSVPQAVEGPRMTDEGRVLPSTDLQISRLLQTVYDEKEEHGSLHDIQGLCMILTMYDQYARELEFDGMDLVKGEGLDKFMDRFLPDTYRTLHFYGLDRTIFVPTWVDLEVMDGKVQYWPGTVSPKIKLTRDGRPSFPTSQFVRIIDWIMSMAA
jgi:hypothetical protein